MYFCWCHAVVFFSVPLRMPFVSTWGRSRGRECHHQTRSCMHWINKRDKKRMRKMYMEWSPCGCCQKFSTHHITSCVFYLFGWSASSLVWILLLVRARVTYTAKGGIETPGRQVGYSFVDISGGITKELNGIDSRHMCIVHAGRSRFFSNSLWQVVTDADQLNRLIREGRCPIGSHRWGMNQHMPCKVSLMRHRFSIGYVGGLNFTCVVAKRTRWYP